MTDCMMQLKDGKWSCPDCEWTYPLQAEEPPKRNCPVAMQRVGSILHELLRNDIGAGCKVDCNCRKWMEKMNAWGPAGCREHLAEIVDTLLAEAERRNWKLDGRPLLSKAAYIGTKCPLGKALARRWARKLVLTAIERSEQQTSKGEGDASRRRQ